MRVAARKEPAEPRGRKPEAPTASCHSSSGPRGNVTRSLDRHGRRSRGRDASSTAKSTCLRLHRMSRRLPHTLPMQVVPLGRSIGAKPVLNDSLARPDGQEFVAASMRSTMETVCNYGSPQLDVGDTVGDTVQHAPMRCGPSFVACAVAPHGWHPLSRRCSGGQIILAVRIADLGSGIGRCERTSSELLE